MNKKRVLKITPVLITLNILVLFVIAGFYGFRMYKYYKLENGTTDDNTPIYLVDEVKKKRSYLDDTKGLVLDEKTGKYIYKGEVNDNYIYYSGMYFRIMEVDEKNRIKAISEDNVTLMYPGFSKGYKDSYINSWLNTSEEKNSGVYEGVLVTPDTILTNTSYCTDQIADVANITCEEKTEDYKITLLSLYDYKTAGGKSSYLNNGKMFNLGSLNDKNLSYYVTDTGEIALHNKDNHAILVRPVITFNSNLELLGGNGKKESPFIVEKREVKKLSDVYVGNYIKVNNESYKIVSQLEDKTFIVKSGVIKLEDKNLEVSFGGSNNIYSAGAGIGKYLNTTYLNSLDIKDNVVSGYFYNGLLTLDSYDYKLLKSANVNTKVGMLTMGDLFINEEYNVLTTLRGIEANNIIYTINKDGSYFGDTLSAKYNVRPALYVKNDLEISGGKGSIEEPFELGVKNETEEKQEK